MTSPAEWMKRYAPDNGIGPLYGAVHAGDGRRWVTDGRSLLAVADPAATLAELDAPHEKADVRRRIREIGLCPVPADAGEADLSDLWLWLDRVERETCPACGGNTWPYRELAAGVCTFCDGSGWVWPDRGPEDPDAAGVAGAVVDRNRLAWWLAGELGEVGRSVRCWSSGSLHAGSDNKGRVLFLDGGGWRLVTMGLLLDPPPRCRTYHPGAGQWWQYRADPVSRLTAADWAAERGLTAFDLFGQEYPELEGVGA